MREGIETRADDRPDTGTRCAACHGPCVVAGSPAYACGAGPALAWMTAGDVAATYGVSVLPEHETDAGECAVCDRCVALAARWAIADGRPTVGYVNVDASWIVAWGGSPIARIVRSNTFRNNIGADVLAWSAELPSGAKCYGRNAGRGMVTNIRSAAR